MEVYEIKDLKTKKVVKEIGEHLDDIALAYLDVIIDFSDREFPEGASDEQWTEFCNNVMLGFVNSLEKAFEKRGL